MWFTPQVDDLCSEDPEEREDDDGIGMWTFIDIVRGSAPVRVPRPQTGHNATEGSFLGFGRKPRVVQTDDRSLALRRPRTADLGLYECRRDGNKYPTGSTVGFLIDMDIASYERALKREESNLNGEQDDEDPAESEDTDESSQTVIDEQVEIGDEAPSVNGTFADWPIYQGKYLVPLEKFISLSNLHLEAISEWSLWTECKHCWTTKYGIRARRGVCVLRLPLHETDDDDVVAKELAGLPALACRSSLLSQLYPQVGAEAQKVPDFIEFDYQGCNGKCSRNDSRGRGSLLHRLVYLFRHRRDAPLLPLKRLTLNAGEAFVIICPDATAETPVHWEKDGEAIEDGSSGTRTFDKRNPVQHIITKRRQGERWVRGAVVGIKAEPDNTPTIDSMGALKVQSAAPRNTGSYVCSVNGTPRGTFQVEVIARSTLSFDDLMRHFAYVSLVLLSCIMIWCGVIICVSLRERLRKRKYSKVSQPSTPPSVDSSESPKSDDESTIDNAEKGKKKTKHKTAQHYPSRKSSRAADADSPGPPSPPAASYHKVPSRLRIRHLSRFISRSSASNNEMELVRLLPTMRPTNYQPSRRCQRQQQFSASSPGLDEDKSPVVVISQHLFPASQRTLRPLPQTNPCRSSMEIQEQRPAPPCSWVASPISASVLRARNSSRQTTPVSSFPKISKAVHVYEKPTMQRQASTRNIRIGAHKRPRKRRPKSNVFSKPRKSRSQWKKHRGQFSSLASSPARKTPALSAKPKISPRQISLNKPSHSRSNASPMQASSPTRRESERSPGKSSPRLSLLYKALPSPKLAASSSVSRDHVSSISFLSNSAGYSTADQDVRFEGEKSIVYTSTRSAGDIFGGTSNGAPTRVDKTKSFGGLSPQRLSIQASAPNERAKSSERSTDTPKRLSVQKSAEAPDSTQPDLLSVSNHPTSQTQIFSQICLPSEGSQSQQSMFEIKSIVEKPTQPRLSEIPTPTFLSRQPSTVLRGPTPQIEQCDSLEKLKLVAAFLETAQKKSAPGRSHSSCVQATAQTLSPKSTNQGSFLMPPAVPIASPRHSEISLPTPPPPPEKVSSTKCNASSAFAVPNKPQPTRQKLSSKMTFSRQRFFPRSKPSQNQTTTKVSRQLLPALISPCAIALPDNASVVNELVKTPFLFDESSLRARNPKPVVQVGVIPVNTSSTRSSTSTQAAINPSSDQETRPQLENQKQRSLANLDSVSRSHISLAEAMKCDHKNVVIQEHVACSEMSVNSRTPVKYLSVEGKWSGPRSVSPKRAESVHQEQSRCSDQVPSSRETRSEDALRGSPTRFRTLRPEADNRGNSDTDWIAAHHKVGTSKERVRFSDTVTTLRKNASTRYSKHKGFFVRQKPEVDKFQVVLVDTDSLRTEHVPSESHSRETPENTELPKMHTPSALIESVTQSVVPATAIALPQIISAQNLWPVNPSTSQQTINDPQLIQSHFQPIAERRPQDETHSKNPTVPSSQELVAVSKRNLMTKPTKTVRRKPSIYRVRNRLKKSSQVSMSTITDPLEFRFKGAKDAGNIPHLRPVHPQSSSFNFSGGLDRGFIPYALELKLTQSLPQASGSPSLSKLLGPPDSVSKSVAEVKVKPQMKPLTPKSSRSPLYLQSPISEDSRFANQLLVKNPSSVSSRTTQVEKGEIGNTCDAQVQSAVRSDIFSEQRVDESTSFGSLCESTRRARLPTAEMASQVSNLITTEDRSKRTVSPAFVSKRQLPRPILTTKIKSPLTTTPRNDTIKGRATKQQSSGPPSFKSSPEMPPSRLPVPVKKKSFHRIKPEARAKPPKIPVQKPTRSTAVRKPPLKQIRGRTGSKSPSPPLNVRNKQTASRPLKSGALYKAACNNSTKAEDTSETIALQDYDSHHIVFQPQVARSATGERRPKNQESRPENLQSNTSATIDSTEAPSNSVADSVAPAPTDPIQRVVAISRTQTVSSTGPVQQGTELTNQMFSLSVREDTLETRKKQITEETPLQNGNRSNSQSTLTVKCSQKPRRNQIRRSSTSFAQSLKVRSSIRQSSPIRPESRNQPSAVFVFSAAEQSETASSHVGSPLVLNSPRPRASTVCVPVRHSLLTGARNFINDIDDKQSSPAFLKDGFVCVRGISNVDQKME